jgi:tetratricopeptide (TPR) repeat protein
MTKTLDLRYHGIDEAAGKTLILNGTEYVLHELADEGGETFIFPLENTRSGLVLFLAKIYKFRPPAHEYQERLRDEATGFVLSLVGIDNLYEEQYEIPGALMKFQLHVAGGMFTGHWGPRESTPLPSTERAHNKLVEHAQNLIDACDRSAAMKILEHVLELNPQHSFAMVLLAEQHMMFRAPNEVIRLAKSGLAVEPNDVRFYQLAARAYIDLGQPDEALEVVNSGLQRYEWDWASWDLKRQVATRFAMGDLLEEMAENVVTRIRSTRVFNDRIHETVTSGFQERRKQLASFHREADRASDLVDAISLLLEVLSVADPASRLRAQFANGYAILSIGRKWKDAWLGRVLAFLACSFFLMEPTQAAEVYGGIERVISLMHSESLETYFLKGFGGVFRGEKEVAANGFRAAAKLHPNDPFVLFGVVLSGRYGADFKREADKAMATLNRDHPISKVAGRFHA